MNRILLDRSIFHGDKLKRLQDSNVQILCAKRILAIYGNPTLLQETFNLWIMGRKEEAKKHLRFILDISNGRWFRALDEINKLELEGHNLGRQYYFYSKKKQKEIENEIIHSIINDNIDKDDEKWIKSAVDKANEMKIQLKKACSKARSDFSNTLKNKKIPFSKDIKNKFEFFHKSHIEAFGTKEILTKLKTEKDRKELVKRWKKFRSNSSSDIYNFPFFNLWLKAAIYIAFYAIGEQNKPIDPNAGDDISQIIFMKPLDIFVSDDIKFMKDAFQQLYGCSKTLMTLDEFLNYIKKYSL